ncbi:MAG TPA: sugar phosphate isomerase/epimerase [Candidatus Glassbacteria bacterium]|nr:sugar phosphate isomerase/epimerase [Candidatus Glassbacteria bacterium]
MPRPVTLFTGQWADLPLATMCEKAAKFGYDGLELACWGDHMELEKALAEPDYCANKRKLLEKHGLRVWAISNHLSGQLTLDLNDDERTDIFAPAETHGDPEAKRAWAIEQQKKAARAAKKLGVKVVCGFTGSPIWHLIYSFPPVPKKMIDDGFRKLADVWNPILDVYRQEGVKFALEVHPTEIAFDIVTARRTLEALDNRPEFGFNFDPSHLEWQGVDPVRFIQEFPDRIFHVHMKDAIVTLDGRSGILSSYLNFDQPGRGWNFRSLGRGSVDFEAIIRELNVVGYTGPLSVEWEDAAMNREHGAIEACEFVRNIDFPSSDRVFDEAFGE